MSRDWLRRWPLGAVFLITLYGVLRQRTWSVDGCLHTLNSDHFMDHHTFSHLLLRPVCFLWISIWKHAGVTTHAQAYDALQVLFAGLGVAALTMLFAIARRRGGEAAAWIGLVCVAFARDAIRQITVFDEKPLGMVTFALAVLATARLFRSGDARAADPPGLRAVLPAAGAWLLAMFGHLQNVPFALAFLVTLALWRPGAGTPRGRSVGLAVRAGLVMALVGLVLFTALHWQIGGLTAGAQFVRSLLVDRQAPAPSASLVHLWLDALQGWVKAFFIVDRTSPTAFLWNAAVGFAVLALATARGFARRRDALGAMLLAGGLILMVLMPVANAYPGYGDSYTMIILVAFVLLATAPRRLLLAGAALVVIVNLPPVISYAYPSLTMQRNLAAMIEIQRARNAPWLVLEELAGFPGEQELVPVYYRMREDLRFIRCSFDDLPAGPCLIELPLLIGPGGVSDSTRVGNVQRELERRGRTVTRRRLWDPLRTVGADFHDYGHYLIVDPA